MSAPIQEERGDGKAMKKRLVLFEYLVLLHPENDPEEKRTGKDDLFPVKSLVIARGEKMVLSRREAHLEIVNEIPERFIEHGSRLEIVLRRFSSPGVSIPFGMPRGVAVYDDQLRRTEVDGVPACASASQPVAPSVDQPTKKEGVDNFNQEEIEEFQKGG